MHVLFDLDGTLTDPREGIVACIQYALSRLDIELQDNVDLTRYIGPPLRDSFEELCGSAQVAERAVAIYRERFSAQGLFENRLYDGITKCLSQLSTRVDALHVATSKPGVFAERIIHYFNLHHYFDTVYGSQLDGSLSDKTELLGHILASEKLLPHEAVMIGDRSFDMVGASKNGIRSIGVLWGYGTVSELTEAGADALCRHPAEICETLFKS